jgi:transposase
MIVPRSPREQIRQPERVEFVPKQELEQAQRQIEKQQRQIERLQQEIERLREELEAALRAGKRQAAPHSRGKTKNHPKRPGRKPGRAYGKHACRRTPSRVDETIAVPLPPQCPHCGGGVEWQRQESQYQEEIVRRTVVRHFAIAVGCCRGCGHRVQGRHPLQTSDAVGVGAVQLGPEALALAAILNKQMGLSLGHTQQVLAYGASGWKSVAVVYTGRWRAWRGAPRPPTRGWWEPRDKLR